MLVEPERAGGSHFVEAGDMAELAFQRRGDGGSHDGGAGAGQCGLNADGREIHLRQRGDRQLQIRNDSRQDDGGRKQAVPIGRRMNGEEIFMAFEPAEGRVQFFPARVLGKVCCNRSKYR